MGSRRSSSGSVSTAVNSVDSSPCSAESSFRELDDAFLKTQTRIWLGEVLKTRFDEQLNISDLLADGELLFEVSKLVWNMLLEKCVELRQIKAYQCPLGSRKSSGRYMPYSNVDSFLKVCKILGLNGIDLFSPSDVVERRGIRKVCICIRALSKKARSKQLNVPDFDLVTYTVVMPTDVVGCIRRSLESSQSSVSSSSSCHSYKQTRSKSRQKNFTPSCSGNYNSSSEESDEAESAYYGIESHSSSTDKFDYPASPNSCSENSSGRFSAVKPYTAGEAALQSNVRNLYRYGIGKHCSLRLSRNGYQADNLSRCYFKARGDLDNWALHTSNDLRRSYGNASELADIDLALGNDSSDIGDLLCDDVAERNVIADYLAFSDSVVLRNDGNSPIFFNGEDNICNFFMSIDSHGLDSKQKICQNGFPQRSSDDMEDVEVGSVTSMSSIIGRVLNMEFDDQFIAGDSSILEPYSIGSLENETDNQDKRSLMEGQTPESARYEILSSCSATDMKESQSKMKLENEGFCTTSLSTCKDNGQPYAMESQKFEICGDSQKYPGTLIPAKSVNLAPAKDGKENFRSSDMEKTVMGMSELNPDLEHGKSHCPLVTLHHIIFQEAKVSYGKCPIKGNERHVCSMQYEDIIIKDVTRQGSHDPVEGSLFNRDFVSLANECESMAEKHPSSCAKNSWDVNGAGHQAATRDNDGIQHYSVDGNEDGRNHSIPDISAENVFDGKKDPGGGIQKDKLPIISLLKTFVKGTTLFGMLFLVLHISRRGKEEADKPQKLLKTQGLGGAKSASLKEKSSRPSGIYPTENLTFGN